MAKRDTETRALTGTRYSLPKDDDTVRLFEAARAELIAEGATDLRIATILRAGLRRIVEEPRGHVRAHPHAKKEARR